MNLDKVSTIAQNNKNIAPTLKFTYVFRAFFIFILGNILLNFMQLY